MMARFRGLLPGGSLPLMLALIAIAIGATTLHRNEMRDLIAPHDERAVREAANSSAEHLRHQVQLAQAARAERGDYAALAQPISGIGEIQTLHATLAQMADELRRYQRSLQSYAADVI